MAFHPYPQVIRAVFNPHRFGPPLRVTAASPCSWVDRPGFGSTPGYSVALVTGLAFAAAPLQSSLASHPSSNSPDHNAKGTQSARTPDESDGRLLPLVGTRFQDLFHSPLGVLFTFPSRYWSTIGHGRVFSLGGWSPQLRARFLVSGATQEHCYASVSFSATGLSPSLAPRSRGVHVTCADASAGPTTPGPQGPRFGLGSVSLAATPDISVDFSSSRY